MEIFECLYVEENDKQIQNNIIKRLDVNSLNIGKDNIIITKSGRGYKVSVSLNKEFKIGENITVSIDASVEENSEN